MITPGKDFKDSDYGKTWNDVVDSPQFQAAIKAAALDYMVEAKSIEEVKGVQGFIRKLMHLCDNPVRSRTDMSPNLIQPR